MKDHELLIRFSPHTYGPLTALAARRGLTLPELVREALNLEQWWHDTIADGSRILVERDGRFVEVVWGEEGQR